MITEENSKCNRGQYAEMIKKDVRGASRAGEGAIYRLRCWSPERPGGGTWGWMNF
jgi:hypothetical protein